MLRGVLVHGMYVRMMLGWVVGCGLAAAWLVAACPVSEGLSSDNLRPVVYRWPYLSVGGGYWGGVLGVV